MESLIVKQNSHIEIKTYFLEQNMGGLTQKIFLVDEPKTMLEDGNIIYYIAYFKYPNYKTYTDIMEKATTIDEKNNAIFVNPKSLELWIINVLLYAIVDMNGERFDITDENRKDFLQNVDPAILNGIYLEFRRKCSIIFR